MHPWTLKNKMEGHWTAHTALGTPSSPYELRQKVIFKVRDSTIFSLRITIRLFFYLSNKESKWMIVWDFSLLFACNAPPSFFQIILPIPRKHFPFTHLVFASFRSSSGISMNSGLHSLTSLIWITRASFFLCRPFAKCLSGLFLQISLGLSVK